MRHRTTAVALAVILLAGCTVSTPTRATPAPAAGSPPAASPVAPIPSASADAAAAELGELVRLLEQTHPEPYHSVSRSEFRAALDDYAADLPRLSNSEAVVGMMRVWALLSRDGRDGHQFALPVDEHAGPILPIRVYEFADGLHVTAAAAPHETLAGARITAIADVPVDEVLAAVEPLVPRDGPSTVPAFRPILLLRTDVLAGLGIVGEGPVELDVELADGSERTVALDPMPLDAYLDWAGAFGMSQLPSNPDLAYLVASAPFTARLLDGGVAHLRYRFIAAPDLAEVRGWLEAGEVDRMVLDLRQNPGGDNTTFAPLLALVRDFAATHPRATAVLTDRITFSAAANLATSVERATDAIFVGEPMGGGLNFWDDVGWVELRSLPVPMRVAVSTRWWEFADPNDPRLTIEPDILVPVAAADHFAGHDPALEAALAALGAPE